jgi:NAD+ synthase
MGPERSLSPDVLKIDGRLTCREITGRVRALLKETLHKRGLVVGISGGIDSSVTAALCVEAVGPERVIGLQMPERHSAAETMGLSTLVADHLGIAKVPLDITGVLEAVGYYARYDEAVRSAVPGYGPGWRSKIVASNVTEGRGYTFFSIVAAPPEGEAVKTRLDLRAYLEIVACTNFKQRIRKMFEYYHADRHNYAVAGTPNRLEYDQGFFVKLGDGAADLKPIAHLYKSQVYQLARHLGLPDEIVRRPPTTDTYSLPQGQDEFFFSIPYESMDLCLYGKNHGLKEEVVGPAAGLTAEQVAAVYQDIDRKRASTRYLHLPPLLVADVPEVLSEGPASLVRRGAE